ncbi:MAG TPA: type II secretion system F family protein [Actinomycetota bacterium]|nr:type II secretion system F family protein [Actinomycetota bacterium]
MSYFIALMGIAGLGLLYSGLTRPPAPERGGLTRRVDDLARDGGIRASGRALIASSLALWFVTFVIVTGISSSLVVGGAISVAAASLPFGWVRGRARRRRRRHREAWPDVIAMLIAAVRAGVSLPEATASLAERAPAELRAGFRAFASSYRAAGSFTVGLARLRDELRDPVADRVAAALALAHEVGGTDLVRVLRATGDFVREDLRVAKEIEARWSWTVVAARMAAAAPWVVLLLMSTRPEAAAAYNSSAGVAVIAGGALATAVGYRLMLRAARLPEEKRLP